jgi:hypothetical protein
MSSGYLYVLSNPAMPGILKIGMSTRSGAYLSAELYKKNSGIPLPFVLEFEIFSHEVEAHENSVYEELAALHVNVERGFFRIDVPDAIASVSGSVLGDHGLYVREEWCELDPSDVLFLSHETGLHPMEIKDALREVTPDDIPIFRQRGAQKREIRKRFYAEGECSPSMGMH